MFLGCTPIAPSESESGSVVPVEAPQPEPEPEPEPEPGFTPRYPGPCRAEIDARGSENAARDGLAETIVTFDYDDAFHLVQRHTVSDNRGVDEVRTEDFTYDAQGRLATRRTTTSRYVQDEWLHYDAEGRLVRTDADDKGLGKPRWRTEQKHDAQGRMILRRNVRVSPRRVGFKRAFVHDGDRLVKERVDNAGDGTWPLEITIKYDDQGRVFQRVREWNDRPVPAEIEHFKYDERSRLVTRTREHYSDGRPAFSTSVTFEYDEAGNVLSKKAIHDSLGTITAQTDYSYDCWADVELTEDNPDVLIPFEYRTRLDQVPEISF